MANFNCLTGCVSDSNYTCSGGTIQYPITAASYGPYVKVTISGASDYITVGNNSSPSTDNNAVIKSMNYGWSDGAVLELEVVDESGGDFSKFMARVNKSLNNIKSDYILQLDFGWITVDNNNTRTLQNAAKLTQEPPITFMITEVNATYEGGVIKFKLQCRDLMDAIAGTRTDENEGDDDNTKDLKSALQDMFADTTRLPIINNITWRTIGDTTKDPDAWYFEGGNTGGPKTGWKTNQQNKLAAARKWIENVKTNHGFGVIMSWNPSNSQGQPEVIFWEKPDKGNFCSQNIGTFIVNGGSCSSVISFTPTIHWTNTFDTKKGGGLGSTSAAANSLDDDNDDNNGGGVATPVIVKEGDLYWRPNDTANQKNAEAYRAHARANRFLTTNQLIEAELKIQGNPKLASLVNNFGHTCSIIIINPQYVASSGSDSANGWLCSPPCNDDLSSNQWWIKSINHQIDSGSYVTIIKVYLNPGTSNIEGDDGDSADDTD